MDGVRDKLLVIKVYDKVLDLMTRNGSHLVGSRIATILGSSRQLSLFEKRLRKVQATGMTRIEVSLCRAAMRKYRLNLPSVRTLWH